MGAKYFDCLLEMRVNFELFLFFFLGELKILEDGPAAPRAPPASKEVVAKLPVTTVTADVLTKLGADSECAICTESLVLNDKMQELPCKHIFHPPCLKPWLVKAFAPLLPSVDKFWLRFMNEIYHLLGTL